MFTLMRNVGSGSSEIGVQLAAKYARGIASTAQITNLWPLPSAQAEMFRTQLISTAMAKLIWLCFDNQPECGICSNQPLDLRRCSLVRREIFRWRRISMAIIKPMFQSFALRRVFGTSIVRARDSPPCSLGKPEIFRQNRLLPGSNL